MYIRSLRSLWRPMPSVTSHIHAASTDCARITDVYKLTMANVAEKEKPKPVCENVTGHG